MHILLNGQAVFALVRQITGCSRIGCFQGRIYRCVPGSDHHDAWHDDLGNNRLVALTINLSPAPYAGGVLQIREALSKTMLQEVPNTVLGDGVLFRLDPSLEHRITELQSGPPKTAFAGWFHSQPDFLARLRSRSAPGRSETGG
jgi:hypothetical protein